MTPAGVGHATTPTSRTELVLPDAVTGSGLARAASSVPGVPVDLLPSLSRGGQPVGVRRIRERMTVLQEPAVFNEVPSVGPAGPRPS